MGKNVGLTYGEFKFPSEQGFTGSAGKQPVKGYMRGGHVKSPDKTKGKGMSRAGMPKNVKAEGGVVKAGEGGYYGKPGDKYPTLKSGPAGARSAMPKGVKKHGGRVKKQMGGYMGPEREIAVDDVKITVPKNRGGKMSMHDKAYAEGEKMGYNRGGYHDAMYKHGGKMGYAYGGQVKDTSGEFVAKRAKQDTMDHGVQPAQKGNNEAEVEAGGNKRLKAGYGHGGGVHRVRDRTKGKGKSRAGFPATVKARGGLHKSASRRAVGTTRSAKGGLMEYAHGGYAAKPAGDKKTHPTGRGRKPYTGYNKQPGGSGNEDSRYMK
jgi:hypothetical protein